MDKNDSSTQQNLFENTTQPKEKVMINKVNLLEVAAADSVESSLEVVRLGNDETAIILFTADSEEVTLHYCSETEINSYVTCNGAECVLCQIGRSRDQKMLLPVYLPAAGCIGVLPVSRSLRPFALLPQISSVLKAQKPMVMFVTRDGARYTVSTAELQKDVDGGEAAMKRFLEDYDGGSCDLSAVYPKIANEELANVKEIARMMALKGVSRDARDKRS
jgi:hypothetical protein